MNLLPNSNPVGIFKKEFDSIKEYLSSNGQVSYVSDLNKYFRKVLILSSGSFFEEQIYGILNNFFERQSNGDSRITNFLQKQALANKYHTLFEWGRQNKPEEFEKKPNKFLSLFGESFKSEVNLEIRNNKELDESIKAFLEIGHLRNILVHSNFADYNYEQKDTEEIFELFVKAMYFVDYLRRKLLPKLIPIDEFTLRDPHYF